MALSYLRSSVIDERGVLTPTQLQHAAWDTIKYKFRLISKLNTFQVIARDNDSTQIALAFGSGATNGSIIVAGCADQTLPTLVENEIYELKIVQTASQVFSYYINDIVFSENVSCSFSFFWLGQILRNLSGTGIDTYYLHVSLFI